MYRVVRADQDLRARADQPGCRLKQKVAHFPPPSALDQALIIGERKIVQGGLGIGVAAHQRLAFQTDCPVAERRSLAADRYDPDMLHSAGWAPRPRGASTPGCRSL